MRPIRTLLAVLLGLLAFAGSLILTAPAASAHDVAESTSPSNGSTVAVVPEKVSITFGNTPLALGSQIAVNDAQGRNWADGAVEIVDNIVYQKLKPGAPAGRFAVIWRVVSSDSHPIEGTFTFTATAGSDSAGSGSPAATAPVPTAGSAPATAGTGQATAPDASQPLPWSIVGFAVVALALLVILGVTARRRLTSGDEESLTEEGVDEQGESTAQGDSTTQDAATLQGDSSAQGDSTPQDGPETKPEQPGKN